MSIELIGVLSTLVTIGLAVALIYHFWQEYVVDVTRQQLFELRNQIFDLAMSGELDRESEAYLLVREMFNSSIRFAHKMNLVRFLFVVFVIKFVKKVPLQSNAEKVKHTIEQIQDRETRDKLWNVLKQMHLVLAWHLFKVSPVILVFTIVTALLTISIGTFYTIRNKFGDVLNGMTFPGAVQHS